MKKIKLYLLSLLLLSAVTGFNFLLPTASVRAADDTENFTAELIALPGEVLTPDGYLSSRNTGFRVNVQTAETFEPIAMAIFIDDFAKPVDERTFDSETNYYLSSNTNSFEALSELLPEGEHTVKLGFKMEEGQPYLTEWEKLIQCDYTAATGYFAATPAQPSTGEDQTVIIDQSVLIDFSPGVGSDDIVSISGLIYGRQLTFDANPIVEGDFQASYVVALGDPSIVLPGDLTLTDITITDLTGNITQIASLNIPIDFSIDTLAPTLTLTSPTISTQLTQGDKVFLEGEATPLSTIILAVGSKTFQTTAGVDGNWKIVLDSSVLELGQHSASLTAIGTNGNKTILPLGSFTLIAPSVPEIVTSPVTGTVTITLADNEPKPASTHYVASKTVNSPDLSAQTVSNQLLPVPQLGSGESTAISGVNWSAWILLLAIVVLASALATAGYYGYAWIGARNSQMPDISANVDYDQQARPEPPQTTEQNPPAANEANDLENSKPQDDNQPPVTRW